MLTGLVHGRTLLPVPLLPGNLETYLHGNDEVDQTVLHTIESTIVNWSHQVHTILKKDTSPHLKQGCNQTPCAELQFWQDRCEDFEGVCNQLSAPSVQHMQELLEKTGSSYLMAFKAMGEDVFAALIEARDICLHLKPLRRWLELMERTEFERLHQLIAGLIRIVRLVWEHSMFYKMPARFIVLLQEICNLFIQQAREFLNPDELLKGDAQEGLQRIHVVLSTLSCFHRSYNEECKFLRMNQQRNSWDFSSSLVFDGMRRFQDRVEDVKNILLTTLDMEKLEKVETGGPRGKSWSCQMSEVLQNFHTAFNILADVSDCLDVHNVVLEKDLKEFWLKIEDFDCRLGRILLAAFNDASGLEQATKVLAVFGSLLNRPVLAMEAKHCCFRLLHLFDIEMDAAQAVYAQQLTWEMELRWPLVSRNMPTTAGHIVWAQGLQRRIEHFYSLIAHIYPLCLESEDASEVIFKYKHLFGLLVSYKERLYSQWACSVTKMSQCHLSKPLLQRDTISGFLSINFSFELMTVLRETHYLQALQPDPVPALAQEIYERRETYRLWIAVLSELANGYNDILGTLLTVERPLVQGCLEALEHRLENGLNNITWKSVGVWEYIQDLKQRVQDLQSCLYRSRSNVEVMRTTMGSWLSPVFNRPEGKHESLLSLADREQQLEKWQTLMADTGRTLHMLLKVMDMKLVSHS
uniref:RUN domain-containing protein n=1 Tax=Eptatretus burgeri TaxID=7764 RepID=A0A8C4QJK0_EPTBU